ncbi:DUF3800 domain-containing protein [Nocardia flavorosea]|uniref:DUF3800 domain-containing protein n=1 Tax=Nocardia flavorosea TaxID=53429 RepID=UPI001893D1EE|nr:DUF3800 domain-containing protein [Nocardia flavorosea]MBF6350381.1 DUF3800 domain-containing protein [Nocardia flavorosea]
MLLAYIDETYKRGEEHWVSALACPADSIPEITAALDEVVERAVDRFPELDEDAELHGYEVDAGSGHWEPLKGKARARVSVYRDAVETIASFEDLAWFRGGLIERKVDWHASNDPHEWSLKFTLEKLNVHAKNQDQHILCICDEVQNRDVYREKLQDYRRNGTGGYTPSRLPRIADTLHFAPSCHSRMVQAVDMVTYVLNRHRHPAEHEKTRAFYAELWDMLEDLRARGSVRYWPL